MKAMNIHIQLEKLWHAVQNIIYQIIMFNHFELAPKAIANHQSNLTKPNLFQPEFAIIHNQMFRIRSYNKCTWTNKYNIVKTGEVKLPLTIKNMFGSGTNQHKPLKEFMLV